MCCSPQEEKTDRAQVKGVLGRQGHQAEVRGKLASEPSLGPSKFIHSTHSLIHSIVTSRILSAVQ